jgi:hypothetical protein
MFKKIIIINFILFILITSYCNAEVTSNLEILAIENEILYPAFDNQILEYNVEVSNEVTKLNIFAVPEDEEGKVEIKGNDNILEGNNSISVTVTSSNGNKREYKINVYKRNLEEEKEYIEKQNQKAEKLEEAYKIEKELKKEETIENEKIIETEEMLETDDILESKEVLYTPEKTKTSITMAIPKIFDIVILISIIVLIIIVFIIIMKKYKFKNDKKNKTN